MVENNRGWRCSKSENHAVSMHLGQEECAARDGGAGEDVGMQVVPHDRPQRHVVQIHGIA